MKRAATLDHSGYVQVNKETLTTTTRPTFYAELHGYQLYCWTEKPRDEEALPVSSYNLDGARVTRSAKSRLDVIVEGPQLDSPVTFTFAAEPETGEWVSKLSHCNPAHTTHIPVQGGNEGKGGEGGTGPADVERHDKNKASCEDFRILHVLGKGAFGCVTMVEKKDTGARFAMKQMSKRQMAEASGTGGITERSVMSVINHPFIARLHYAFQDEEYLYIVISLLGGGELFHHLEQERVFTEERARFYAAEIGLAIGYLHERGVIYRDLKPENVVLDLDGHACLTDFGLAKENIGVNPTANTFCGTPEYQAPEFLLGCPHGRAVDWWSLGIMLYEMLFGIPPFYHENTTTMSELILRGKFTFDENGCSASPEAQDLITRLLAQDPSARMQTVAEFKKHPFFAGLDFDKLYRRELTPPFIPDPDPVNNFDESFTDMPTMLESHNGAGVHPNVAGFTYNQDDELEAEMQREREASAAAAAAAAAAASTGGVKPASRKASTSSGSPKQKPASPVVKKSGPLPSHLVAKVAPKRPN